MARPERVDGLGPDHGSAVDEERRRAAHAERAALREVGLDGGGEAVRVQARDERLARQADLGRVADEIVTLEVRLGLEEPVVIRPVLPERAGTAGGLVGERGQRVGGQGEVLEHEAHPPVVVLQDLRQRPLDALAVRSLVVGELDDRHRRAGRALDHRGVDGELDLASARHTPPRPAGAGATRTHMV